MAMTSKLKNGKLPRTELKYFQQVKSGKLF